MSIRDHDWRATSALSLDQLAWVADWVAQRPWFHFYHQAALDDLGGGLDNRSYLIGRRQAGLLMAIAFQGIDIITVVDDLDDDELVQIAVGHKPAEVHASAATVTTIAEQLGKRVGSVDAICYCVRKGETNASVGSARILTIRDYPAMRRLYERHYPATTLSPWMLDLPFAGVFEGDEIVACAGTMVTNDRLGAAHIGHFITHPEHRGRGHAQSCGAVVLAELERRGFQQVMLGVAAGNGAALAAYKRLGFSVLERRPLIYMKPGQAL